MESKEALLPWNLVLDYRLPERWSFFFVSLTTKDKLIKAVNKPRIAVMKPIITIYITPFNGQKEVALL